MEGGEGGWSSGAVCGRLSLGHRGRFEGAAAAWRQGFIGWVGAGGGGRAEREEKHQGKEGGRSR